MYFFATRQGPLGPEHYDGHETTGWKVTFRRGGSNRPLQRIHSNNPSRFGVLRQIIREGRAWHGRIFYLDVQTIEPIVKVHYNIT